MFRIGRKNKPKTRTNTFLRFTSLGFQMGITIYLMNLLGVWLDGKYPSKIISYTPVLTLFAVFGTIFSVIRQVIIMGKEEDKKDAELREEEKQRQSEIIIPEIIEANQDSTEIKEEE